MNELQQLEDTRNFLLQSIQQFGSEIADGKIETPYSTTTDRATVTAANAHRIAYYSNMLQKVEAKITEKCKK